VNYHSVRTVAPISARAAVDLQWRRSNADEAQGKNPANQEIDGEARSAERSGVERNSVDAVKDTTQLRRDMPARQTEQ